MGRREMGCVRELDAVAVVSRGLEVGGWNSIRRCSRDRVRTASSALIVGEREKMKFATLAGAGMLGFMVIGILCVFGWIVGYGFDRDGGDGCGERSEQDGDWEAR